MATIARVTRVFLDLYYRLLQAMLTALMAVMILPVSLQIVSRYTDVVERYMWTEEIARFCFVWIVMIGSMIAVRDGSHFNVDLLSRPGTRREEGFADLVVHVFMLLLALVFIWYGGHFAGFGSDQESEMSGINMLSIYIAFPLAGATWAVFLVETIVADVRSLSSKAGSDER